MGNDSFSPRIPFGLRLPGMLLFVCLLTACDPLKLDPRELTARTDAPQAGPNCASCHAYPLCDINHVYHLFQAGDLKTVNGPVTCLDCHSGSLASRPTLLLDSLFRDSLGNVWSGLSFPDSVSFRSLPLFRVDTLRQNHPVPMPSVPGRKPLFQEWMTSLAHMNGEVNVLFDARVSDTANLSGKWAEYIPEAQTCSAVACHSSVNAYRWPAPSKGLPGLLDGLPNWTPDYHVVGCGDSRGPPGIEKDTAP